jgi:hypothetical protein
VLRAEIAHIGSAPAPPWLWRAVRDLAEGRLQAVLHPLGFICVPALRLSDCGVCVHLWARWFNAEAPTTSAIHCHSWDLCSIVLAGRVRNHLLRLDAQPGPAHRVFEIRSTDDEDRIDRTEALVACRSAQVETFVAGEVYTIPAGQFHRTEVPDGHAMTVMLAHTRPDHLDLSLGPVGAPSHRLRRRHCTPAQAARAATEIGRMLGREPELAGFLGERPWTR